MTHRSIPYGPEEITPRWLTQTLRSTESIVDCEVVDFELELIGESKGIAGRLARLILQYSDQNGKGPSTLIAKFPAGDPDMRAMIGSIGLYEREPRFYKELASEVNLSTPRYFYCDLSDNKIDHVMLLEDLSHGRVGDSVEWCSKREAELAIKQLAKFHAQWWNSERLEAYSWLPILVELSSTIRAHFPERSATFLQRFESRIPYEVARVIPELDRILHASATRLSRPPVTMIHGDYQLENLIFDLPGKDQMMAVIDWRSCDHYEYSIYNMVMISV